MSGVRVLTVSNIPGFHQAIVSRCGDIIGVQIREVGLDDPHLPSHLLEADVLVVDPPSFCERVHMRTISGSKVKWIHSTYAGVDCILNQCHSPPSFLLTRTGESFGQLMGEYVLTHISIQEKKVFEAYDDQKQRRWDVSKEEASNYRLLSDLTIGILGLGAIGKRVAEICKVFGMTVWGMTRSPVPEDKRCSHVDHYRELDGLSELLSNSDYVCNILPSTPQTRGLLNGDTLRHCASKRSVFINIGRGDIVSEATIVSAIRKGWLSGAILDVFEKEPLSPDSELWGMPEVAITPHHSGLGTSKECAELFSTNLRLFMADKGMKYTVDWTRGY